ncbi:MAG: TfoX/Sxy family DNA transformation protein [Zetaproteobacteria bacterium]|nr:TfoX/Sxy family DNA transformation protein [Zetaproteobacteria bacterium]
MKSTKIAAARNLGPVTAAEMETFGITHLEQIEEMGWEVFMERYVRHFPQRLHLTAFLAVIGALHDQDWRQVDVSEKKRAQKMILALKAGRGF